MVGQNRTGRIGVTIVIDFREEARRVFWKVHCASLQKALGESVDLLTKL